MRAVDVDGGVDSRPSRVAGTLVAGPEDGLAGWVLGKETGVLGFDVDARIGARVVAVGSVIDCGLELMHDRCHGESECWRCLGRWKRCDGVVRHFKGLKCSVVLWDADIRRSLIV